MKGQRKKMTREDRERRAHRNELRGRTEAVLKAKRWLEEQERKRRARERRKTLRPY